MIRRSLIASGVAGAAALAATLLPVAAFAQTYPDRPVRLIVPYAPGGSADIVARLISDEWGKALGKPLVVENKAGAGGNVGVAEVAKAAGDGYTIGLQTVSLAINPALTPKMPYDTLKDLAPIGMVASSQHVLVVNEQVPAKTVKELIALAKSRPGKLSYATPGTGTIGHMWGELFKSATGTFMLHIPYRGAGPALNDVVGGQVMVYFDQVAASLPHIQSGKLRALAVSWNKRLEVLPQVPTYAELGLNVCNEPSWFGLVAPAGTPKAAIARVQEAVVRALKEPAVRERLAGQGLFATGSSPEEFGAEIKSEIEKMQRVSAYAKIGLD